MYGRWPTTGCDGARTASCTCSGSRRRSRPRTAAATCARCGARHRTSCGTWPSPTRWPSYLTATASRPARWWRSCCWGKTGVVDPLVDGFGRVVRDLRVSVTDRCNFRCTYCMPAEGMQWQPREELLTFEELERVVGVFVRTFGVTGVRLTGGEPTVR